MAITITKEPTGPLLNAYNNCILEFTSDAPTPARATIEIEGTTLEITPNLNLFYINLREVIVVLINQNAFSDDIDAPPENVDIVRDDTLYLEVEVLITVIQLNGGSESITKNFKFLKSVKQLYRQKYIESDEVKVLLPYFEGRKAITYFEGLPFDIPIYSDANRTLTIGNRRTTLNTTLNLLKGVNRLFLSKGDPDTSRFEDLVPMYYGVNDLELELSPTEKIPIPVKKVINDCGEYLKWFNQDGGWSYWRFDKFHTESIDTKKLDELDNDFYNLNESRSPTISTGRTSQGELNLDTGLMDDAERELVKGIFDSPKIYIYTNDRLQTFSIFDWVEVDISGGSQTVRSTKLTKHRFRLKVILPKKYNQTYAS